MGFGECIRGPLQILMRIESGCPSEDKAGLRNPGFRA